ncbi:MAG: DUF2085 domain-containing protein [Candidatus Altiarchaeota archaeon]
MRVAYAIFLILSLFFFSLTIVPPYMVSCGTGWAGGFAAAVFSPFCHQLPERSLFLWGVQAPVCARCFGIYAGILAGTILYAVLSDKKVPGRHIIIAAALPLVLDGATQFVGLRESNNALRLVTGVIFGSVVPYYLIPVFDGILSDWMVFIRRRRLL